MPTRIEINIQTGERKTIELTPDEVADARVRKTAEDIENAKPRPPTLEDRVAALEAAMALKP